MAQKHSGEIQRKVHIQSSSEEKHSFRTVNVTRSFKRANKGTLQASLIQADTSSIQYDQFPGDIPVLSETIKLLWKF